jgi:hypothetical protein
LFHEHNYTTSLENSQKSTGLIIKASQANYPQKITKSIASSSVTLPNENTTIDEGGQQGESKCQFSCFKKPLY